MEEFTDRIIKKVTSAFPELENSFSDEFLERPKDPGHGDIALPCFKFARILKKAPVAIAEDLKALFEDDSHFESISNIKGYLNFKLNRELYAELLLKNFRADKIFKKMAATGKNNTIVIDYSHPNIAKNMGIHNLRSTIIGGALYNIYSFLGYRTEGVNHLGDWGTQFGKLMLALEKWSSKEKLVRLGILHLNDMYVKYHEESKKDPGLDEQAGKWFLRLENNDPAAVEWRDLFVKVSMDAYNKIYRRLNIKFDHITGESFYIKYLDETVKKLELKGLTQKSEGALVVKFKDDSMPPCLLKKSDGATLYSTRDIAAAMYRLKEFRPHKVIYVTDVAQKLHFNQVFRVMEMYDSSAKNKFVHVMFGRLSFGNIQMSTRKGNIVPLQRVLDRAKQKVLEIIESREIEFTDKEATADRIGVGAVIFNDLSVSRIKNIIFDWKKTLSFEGETGPHIQYSFVRMINILEKTGECSTPVENSLLTDEFSFDLLKLINIFPETVLRARDENEPSLIAGYLTDLSRSFNRFYHNNRIVGENENVKSARTALLKVLVSVYGKCMELLNIPKIKKM
ncbi:MAG: arginine--tRNA ligase [Candidatus Delongbacteria bacterium]